MFFFAKKYEKTINLDRIRKDQKFCLPLRKRIGIFFLVQKNQQREKIKNLWILECISLKKAFFKYEKSSTKGKTFKITQVRSVVSRDSNYFLYNFNKNAVGSIKNLHDFKNEIDPLCFDFFKKYKYFKGVKPFRFLSQNE
jgi:hypothetical protein